MIWSRAVTDKTFFLRSDLFLFMHAHHVLGYNHFKDHDLENALSAPPISLHIKVQTKKTIAMVVKICCFQYTARVAILKNMMNFMFCWFLYFFLLFFLEYPPYSFCLSYFISCKLSLIFPYIYPFPLLLPYFCHLLTQIWMGGGLVWPVAPSMNTPLYLISGINRKKR